METLGKTAVFPGGYGRIGDVPHGRIWPDWGLQRGGAGYKTVGGGGEQGRFYLYKKEGGSGKGFSYAGGGGGCTKGFGIVFNTGA